jgi:general secretion pathway protein G
MEVLVVLIIITILATIVGVNVIRKPAEARMAAAQVQIKAFQTALQMYKAEQGRYPTQEQGLEALCVKPAVSPIPAQYPEEGDLESRHVPLDPWKRAYLYLAPGRNDEPYEIISYGADGELGGAGEDADISSSDQ